MKKSNWILGLGVLSLSLAGAQTSLANVSQADVACTQSGGEVQYYSLTDGGRGVHMYCELDGALIEAVTLHKVVVEKQKTLATNAYLTHVKPESVSNDGPSVGLGSPHGKYCAQVGGKEYKINVNGNQDLMCRFSDGSSIEAYTLYTGPKAGRNVTLTRALQGK